MQSRLRTIAAFFLIALLGAAPHAAAPTATSDTVLRAALQRDLNHYLTTRGSIEHLSAISFSLSLPGRSQNLNVTAGRTRYGAGSAVTPDSLWQIGSNTKAFTAATILQLEAAGKLSIDQTIGQWLPQYPAWKNVTIRRLLNMTSGIPSYEAVPAMLAAVAKNPMRTLTVPELIAYVYPAPNAHVPPPTTGYSYSNTNYVLAELIIERATGHSYASELQSRFFRPLDLTNTYYSGTQYAAGIADRMVAGYYFSHEDAPLAPLFGKDVSGNSLSWARASGAIVSTPEDLTRWARALYTGPMLAAKQRSELLSIVSLKTGKPIAKTTAADPRGFGLGVVQIADPDMKARIWFYEGDTMGYRMVYVYIPQRDIVFAFGLNSSPDHTASHSGQLSVTIYKTLQAAGLV